MPRDSRRYPEDGKMLSIILNKYGQSLIDRKIQTRGSHSVYVLFRIYINSRGKLDHIEALEKGSYMDTPLMIYDDRLSNNSGKYAEYPHLLSCKAGYLKRNEKNIRDIMVDNLKKVFKDNDLIDILIRYLSNGINEEELESIPDAESVVFYIQKKRGKYIELFSEPSIAAAYSDYIETVLSENAENNDTTSCDISGKTALHTIEKHSKLFAGGQKPRIITRQVFNLYYAGSNEKRVSCVSAETELNLNAAVDCINKNKIYSKGSRNYYFCSFDSDDPIQIFSNENDDIPKQICSDFFYLEYNTENIGRVSTYRAEIIDRKKAERVLMNLRKWRDMITLIKDDKVIYRLPSLSSVSNIVYSKVTTTEYDNLYHQYSDCVLRCDYMKIIEKIYLKNMYLFVNSRNQLTFFIRCIRRAIMGLELSNEDEYAEVLAGRLLARANIIEHRLRYEAGITDDSLGYVEQNINMFRKRPLNTWVKIREKIRKSEVAKGYALKKSYERMIQIFSELSNIKDMSDMSDMSALVLVGYDLETDEYWRGMNMRREHD